MAKAIEQTRKGLTVGHAGFGEHGAAIGSASQTIHDGDTISARTLGNLSVRFLGVDTPEVSFQFPKSTAFTSIGTPEWIAFLTDPFAPVYGPLALDAELVADLQTRLGPTAASAHAAAGQAARQTLISLVEHDRNTTPVADFRYFLAFAHEVMDRYGRLLCYILLDQPDVPAAERLPSYNERQLQAGVALPYFIWPNINPFRKQADLVAFVPPSADDPSIQHERALSAARGGVRAARSAHQGIFSGPALIEPFELRYLAGRRPPERWVIDLASTGARAHTLLPPPSYIHILPEDRLWIPQEYVPLFESHGWARG
jgi:endonuclease YncB( thermonuclease family)